MDPLRDSVAVVSALLLVHLVFASDLVNQPGANTIQFTIKCKQNKTDHQVTQFQLNRASGAAMQNWKGDFLHSSFESEGMHKNYFVGTVTVQPQRSEGYKLYPGLGYYKLHTKRVDFVNATNICRSEGAHLAIINSDAEASELAKLSKGYAEVWIGVHDPNKNRDFRTIFGTPLKDTGFSKWNNAQPNGAEKQFCVYIFGTLGGLGDLECTNEEEFICEHDLSWDDF